MQIYTKKKTIDLIDAILSTASYRRNGLDGLAASTKRRLLELLDIRAYFLANKKLRKLCR